jgi:Immunoglobulin domain/Galactose oxidase, central domain
MKSFRATPAQPPYRRLPVYPGLDAALCIVTALLVLAAILVAVADSGPNRRRAVSYGRFIDASSGRRANGVPSRRSARTPEHPAELAGEGSIPSYDLNIERTGHSATLLENGKVLIVGGLNGQGPIDRSELFDPGTRSLNLSAQSITPRTSHNAIKLADGRVLISGGYNTRALRSSEIYDPATDSFVAGPRMKRARRGHSATLLPDGRVLIIGGDRRGSAELLDPAAGRFTSVPGRMVARRAFHSSVLLDNGRVLVVGGRGSNNQALASAEIFDLATMSFSPTRNQLRVPRAQATLRVLDDDKVQVIGGAEDNSIELFNAAGRYFTGYAQISPDRGLLDSRSRAAFIHRVAPGQIAGQSAGDQPGALIDREDYSLTELEESGKALLVGGTDGSGRVLGSVVLLSSSAATVTTDQTDYSPGDLVAISGGGWQSGETIRLTLHRDNGEPDTIMEATADPTGAFEGAHYVVRENEGGVTFLLTAEGQSSGFIAQTTFTDSVSALSITSPTTAAPESVATLPHTVAVQVTYRTSPTLTTTAVANIDSPSGTIATSSTQTLPSGGSTGSPLTGSLAVGLPGGTPNGSYAVVVVMTNGTGSTGTVTRTQSNAVIVCSLPVITEQPSNLARCDGEPASFSVVADSSSTLTFQWRRNGAELSGENGDTLTIPSVIPSDAADYDVVVTNECGLVTSSTATLVVNPRPTAQVTGDATICAGETVAIEVTLTGTAPWDIKWSDGQTQTVYASPAPRLVAPASTTTYTLETVTDALCSAAPSDITGSALIEVNTPPVVTLDPADQVVVAGGDAVFTAEASGAPAPSIQWQIDTGGGFLDIPGANGTTLTVVSVTLGQSGHRYRAVFSNVCAPEGVASAAATLSVRYEFSGFFRPIENPPIVNVAKAGSGVPVKFSLSGFFGLGIVAAGYPASQPVTCDAVAPTDAVEETISAGSSSLNYDPTTDQYIYVWKTNKSWAGSCRQLILQLNEGTVRVAKFSFTK